MKKVAILLTVLLAGLAFPAMGQDKKADTYKVKVICDFSKAIEAGKYDLVNIKNAFTFSVCKDVEEVEVRLFHFGRGFTVEGCLDKMEKEGYRPATIWELLALGAKHPDLQRQFSIAALGPRRPGVAGRIECPLLDEDHSRRRVLRGGSVAYVYSQEGGFLASRK